MKRLFLIGLGLVASSLAFKAQAQTTTAASDDKVKFGIRAGANLMNIGKFQFQPQEYGTDYRVGFQGGIYAELPIGNGLMFLPEVMYAQKGAKLKETVAGNTGELDTRIAYLDVPVLLGYNATPALTIFAGPQVSFLLSQKTSIKTNGEEQLSTSSTDNFSKSLVGGAVGLNYKLTPNVNIGGRYSRDFQKTFEDAAEQSKARNQGFALSLGYTF